MVGEQDKMFKSQKYVFLNALILTVFIFAVGVAIGYWFESLRVDKVNILYLNAELSMLDMRVVSDLFAGNVNCENAIKENINFGDKIYSEARMLERYENAQRLSEILKIQHYKYDLLRVMFFRNSITIKERCNESFHTVVYLYQYNEPSLELKNRQAVFSNMLLRVKEKRGSNIVLIPIAGDLNFSSVSLIIREYNITKLPTILIDEKTKITEIMTAEEVNSLIGQ